MYLYVLNSSNLPRQIDNSKHTTLIKFAIALDEIFQNYFKDSYFEDFVCETCSSLSSETRKRTFTIGIILK